MVKQKNKKFERIKEIINLITDDSLEFIVLIICIIMISKTSHYQVAILLSLIVIITSISMFSGDMTRECNRVIESTQKIIDALQKEREKLYEEISKK